MTTLTELKNKLTQEKQLNYISPSFANLESFSFLQRAASLLAASNLVPKEYQNNISNSAIALNIANRIGADPLLVMQNLNIIHGHPSWSSKFLIATINTCGRFSALKFEFFGQEKTDNWGCRAYAIEKSTNEKLIGPDITIGLARIEGWLDRKSNPGKKDMISKWLTLPQKMLMYRAGAWWCDLYAPELSMGIRTEEEQYDIIDVTSDGEVIDQNTTTIKNMRNIKKDLEDSIENNTTSENIIEPKQDINSNIQDELII